MVHGGEMNAGLSERLWEQRRNVWSLFGSFMTKRTRGAEMQTEISGGATEEGKRDSFSIRGTVTLRLSAGLQLKLRSFHFKSPVVYEQNPHSWNLSIKKHTFPSLMVHWISSRLVKSEPWLGFKSKLWWKVNTAENPPSVDDLHWLVVVFFKSYTYEIILSLIIYDYIIDISIPMVTIVPQFNSGLLCSGFYRGSSELISKRTFLHIKVLSLFSITPWNSKLLWWEFINLNTE